MKLKKPSYTTVVSPTLTGHLLLLYGQAITLCQSALISNKGLHSVSSLAITHQPQWLTTCKSGCCVTSSALIFSIRQALQQESAFLFDFDYSDGNGATGPQFV